ncbi:unnamed protein product [Urochloa humidicola]
MLTKKYFTTGLKELEIGLLAEGALKYHQVTDLHRHYVVDITIPSKRGLKFGVLKRVDDFHIQRVLRIHGDICVARLPRLKMN